MTFLAWLTALFIRLLTFTWRVRCHGPTPPDTPCLFVFWHGEQLALSKTPMGRRLSVLVSRSRDGRFGGQVARFLGHGVIVGSSSKGAVAGALGVVRHLLRGGSVALTADGPRGPYHQCGESARRLANLADASVIPMAVAAAHKIHLRSWDRFMIPAPFSKVWVVWGAPLRDASVCQGLHRVSQSAQKFQHHPSRLWIRLLGPWSILGLLLGYLLVLSCNFDHQRARKEVVSTDPAVRARALGQLVDSRSGADAELASRYINDPSARVRRNAIKVVGTIAPRRYLSKLLDRIHDPSLEVRLIAIRILGDSGIKQAAESLFPLLRQPHRVLRLTAAQSLRNLGYTPVQQAEELARREMHEYIEELNSGNDQLRSLAARMLGLSGRPEVVEHLKHLLQDPSSHVVREAALALGRILGSQALPLITPLCQSRQLQDRMAATRALALVEGKLALPLLEMIWREAAKGEGELKRRVLVSLLQLAPWPAPPYAAGLFCGALLDQDVKIADRAARLVQAERLQGCDKELATLAILSEAGDLAAIKRLALIPLANQGGKIMVGIHRRFDEYHAQSTRWISETQWQEIGGKKLEENLPVPVEKKSLLSPRNALTHLLARYPLRPSSILSGDPLLPPVIELAEMAQLIKDLGGLQEARPWLIKVAQEAEPDLRVAALIALIAEPSRQAITPGAHTASTAVVEHPDDLQSIIAAALTSKHLPLRRLAARECTRLGAEALSTGLILIKDKDPETQANGALCLGHIGDAKVVEPLLQLLDQEGQLAALEALSLLGDYRATKEIVKLLLNDHPTERQHERVFIIECLGRLGDGSAAAVLEQELEHPFWKVRLAAARALAHAARRESLLALAVCRVDYFAEIRQACEETRELLQKGTAK